MAETRKELLKSAVVAIMSACLLGAAVYCFFEPRESQTPASLALAEVPQLSADSYSILSGDFLILDAVFSNGSAITLSPLLENPSRGVTIARGYSKEFNATGLKTLILSIHGFGPDLSNATTIVRTLVAFRRDRTVNVTLTGDNGKMIDLGSSQTSGFVKTIDAGPLDFNLAYHQAILDQLQASLNVTRQEASGRGCWRIIDYIWRADADELASMLHGSGTAEIGFALDVNMNLKFEFFKTAGENLTGSTDLKWTGRWGTLHLTYEDRNISWIRYESSFVALVMQ